jgi:hypothetical protein
MTHPPLPVHLALAPADPGYDELEDPAGVWPHIHVALTEPDGRATGSMGIDVWLAMSRRRNRPDEDNADYEIHCRPPGRQWRLLGDTIEQRMNRPIAELRRRRDEDVQDGLEAYTAAVQYRERP